MKKFILFALALLMLALAGCGYVEKPPEITDNSVYRDHNNGLNTNNPIFDNIPQLTPTQPA